MLPNKGFTALCFIGRSTDVAQCLVWVVYQILCCNINHTERCRIAWATNLNCINSCMAHLMPPWVRIMDPFICIYHYHARYCPNVSAIFGEISRLLRCAHQLCYTHTELSSKIAIVAQTMTQWMHYNVLPNGMVCWPFQSLLPKNEAAIIFVHFNWLAPQCLQRKSSGNRLVSCCPPAQRNTFYLSFIFLLLVFIKIESKLISRSFNVMSHAGLAHCFKIWYHVLILFSVHHFSNEGHCHDLVLAIWAQW